MLHRDISVNNVMYEYRDTRVYFILIDFDMATVLAEDYVPSSKHRTGTLAFMAIALIRDAAMAGSPDHQPVPHMICHDFESIYWLCLWCTLVLVVVVDHRHRKNLLDIARAWETKDLWVIASSKFYLSALSLKHRNVKLPPAAVEVRLDAWYARWTNIWMEREQVVSGHALACEEAEYAGRSAPPELDYETAGGVLTRDNMIKKLTEIIPDPYASDFPEPLMAQASPSYATASNVNPTMDRDVSSTVAAEQPVAVSEAPSRQEGSVAVEEAVLVTDVVPQRGDVVPNKKDTTKGAAMKPTAKSRKNKTRAAATASDKDKTTTTGSKASRKKPTLVKARLVETEEDDNNIRKRLRPRKQ